MSNCVGCKKEIGSDGGLTGVLRGRMLVKDPQGKLVDDHVAFEVSVCRPCLVALGTPKAGSELY